MYTGLSAKHESPLHNVFWDLRSGACNMQDFVRVCKIKIKMFLAESSTKSLNKLKFKRLDECWY